MNIVNYIKAKFRTRYFLWSDNAVLIYLALFKLIIHLLTSIGYGYFGDELYFLAMTKHLDFGYVDIPPLIVYLAALSRFLFGASLFAIHLLPAITGAVMVYFAGLMARELGGGRFAQWFTALTVLVAPYILFVNSIFTYDTFDQLCTIILFYLVIRIINLESPKRWLLLGIIIGLGVMTKLSMIYTGGALVISLLLTSRRKSFLTIWPWLALFIAAVICTPYLVWQSVHGWPLLTYFHNYALNPYRPHQQPVQFFMTLFLFQLNPILLPVWLLGLIYILFNKEGRKYRILGFTFLILAIFYTGLMQLESRQLVSACFPLLAAGVIWLERIISPSAVNWKRISWLKQVYIGIIFVSATLMAPISLPILPIPVLEKYWSATPAFIRECDYQLGIIPHHYRFSSGWTEMAKEVAAVYHSLPEAERKKCTIWAGFYWDAGAIDLLGKKYGLPDAISNCQSYHIWGVDRLNSGQVPEVAIMLSTAPGFPAHDYYNEVASIKVFKTSNYSVYSGKYLQIYICRKSKVNFIEAWEEHKFYW
jgi:hypothetical protein